LAGSTSFIGCPAMRSSPPVMSSSPAIIRRSVDLPQPEGPTKTTNSPCSSDRLMSRSTSTEPKDFETLISSTDAIGYPFTAPAVRPETILR
jgi:hypothetical protein